MDMQRLNVGMMERYEIENRRPARVNAVQFGMGEALLGTVDRLIDAAGAGVGIACVQAGEAGYAKRLAAQDGMYTLLIRGYEREEPVRREVVVQCILEAVDPDASPEAFEALAANPDIRLGIAGADGAALESAARFLAARQRAGLPGLDLLCVGFDPRRLDEALVRAGADAARCAAENALCPAFADSLAFRSEADEAAMLCREMNYLDDMLHLAEPYARLTICAPEDLRRRYPLDRAAGVRFLDPADFDRARTLNRRVFDAGVFLMAAPGWLNGCGTLSDCMKHARLRRFVGEAFTRELLPRLAGDGERSRAAVEAAVIGSFERYENPLNRNGLLKAADGLLGRFADGVLPVIEAWAEEVFEPPRRLSFALAATIMLYAGARRNPDTGLYEVARGKAVEVLRDDPEKLRVFSTLAHDMDPESLAYAALADRELWGRDLRAVDGLEARVALDIAAMQREPGFLPEAER